jgi:hypothetical protein
VAEDDVSCGLLGDGSVAGSADEGADEFEAHFFFFTVFFFCCFCFGWRGVARLELCGNLDFDLEREFFVWRCVDVEGESWNTRGKEKENRKGLVIIYESIYPVVKE